MDESLSTKWIEYHATGNKDLFWAWEELESMVRKAPEHAWLQILDIAAATENQEVLSSLAAGPLEDLIALHGLNFIERLETKARQNPEIARLVTGVWRNNIPDSVWERLHAIQTKYS
ncbi:DUF6869 domain-containing protein [Halopseudomonas salegens]|uniref:DUF6869 domain-containing protein n=1 Tax=Halopseudomonas salegens TaxID=1434072 RepID=A0A1H2HIT4_9GAMM|nr:hypothetical protein [Halopseudomonas salegens]SDU31743.1 hypothetical protein SAMN05216210_3073 [Halopseudomonas salegens]